MPSIFTRIIEREIPAHILREDDEFLAFLDTRPIREGHTLVIPKAEIPDVFDLPEELLSGLLPFARPVAKAIQEVTQATRIGMAVIGLEVPHAHVHLVPIDGLHDLDFRRASPAEDDELAATAERIRAALDALPEVTTRRPGHLDTSETAFTSTAELSSALRRAEAAHGEHERRTGQTDANWPEWYAAYMAAEQTGEELPT